MSPRTEKQYEEIRGERKNLIQETALELFATKGFHSTSISMIAKKAGISKGLLYNYYESKEDLLKEIMISGFQQILDMMDPNQDGELTKDELESMIKDSFRIVEEHSNFWSLYFAVLPQKDVFVIIKDQFNKMYEFMYGLMTDYFRKRNVDDPEAEAIILGSLLDGIFINYIFNKNEYPLEAVKKRLLEIYCK